MMEVVPEGMKIPTELEFKPSGMETEQIGVFAKKSVSKDETYGPFLGVKKKLAAVLDDTYSWEIRGPKGRRLFCIDASDPAHGNWMRYVKSARYYEEQNMIAQQENKNIFYKTLRDIPAGEELLCWYNSGEPPSEEAHEALQKESREKKAKEDAEKQTSTTPTKKGKPGPKPASSKSHDVSGDKTEAKGQNDKGQSAKQPEQSTPGTVTKIKKKGMKTGSAKDSPSKNKKESGKKELSASVSVTDGLENATPASTAAGSPNKDTDKASAVLPDAAEVGSNNPLEVDTKISDKELIGSDGCLKSPDMPVLENMTKEGRFLVPSPTKQVYTSLSSSGGSTATAKEVMVGGFVCHEISPPTISPVLPITKNQSAKAYALLPAGKAVVEGAAAALEDIVTSKDIENEAKDKLAIQAPDVSSTEESSGTEREMQHDGDKESHVTSSKSQDAAKDGGHLRDPKLTDEDEKKLETGTNSITDGKDAKLSNIVTVPVYKKGKKSKPIYKCRICGSVFGKPVYVKIHIAKKHGIHAKKSASKGKVFVPGKREKIRTRSVSQTGDKGKVYRRRKWLEKEEEEMEEDLGVKRSGDDKVDKNPVVSAKEAKPSEVADIHDENTDASSSEKKSDIAYDVAGGSASMVPMMYSSRAYGHREGKSCGTYQCEFCRRVFHYRTWLTRHLETKHPGLTPTVSYQEESPPKPSVSPPKPLPPREPLGEFSSEPTLSKEEIELLKATGKGKRLKIYPCSLCGRRFSSKKNVRRHKRIIHKILVRPRRSQLPVSSDYTIEDTIKAVGVIAGDEKESQSNYSAPGPEVNSLATEQSNNLAVAAASTGMRKPRKNKSPIKRSRVVHSEEDYADSYLTFPIEHNPNPLSAFMPTKPVTFDTEPSTAHRIHATGISLKEVNSVAMSQEKKLPLSELSLPSTQSLLAEAISSRRTGTPPLISKSTSGASKSPVIGLAKSEKPSTATSSPSMVESLEKIAPIQSQSLPSNVAVQHRRKPSTVTRHSPSVPYSDRSSINPPPYSSHQVYKTKSPSNKLQQPSTSNHQFVTIPNSSTSTTGPKQARLFNLGLAASNAAYQHPPVRPILTNLWASCARKPKPFVPRKPRTDNPSDGSTCKDSSKDGNLSSKALDKVSIGSPHTRRETTMHQSLSTPATVHQKLTHTLNVLNLKRKVPSSIPPPLPLVSEDGALDLSVSKKIKVETAREKPIPPVYSYPEPSDPNQPLDLSSSRTKSVSKPASKPATSRHAINPALSYASTSRTTPPGYNYAHIPNTAKNTAGPKYEFHHMSPASFDAEPDVNRKKPGPRKKGASVQEMLQQQDSLLMTANKDKPIMSIKQMQQTSPMQIHTGTGQINTHCRPLLPKTSQTGPTPLLIPQEPVTQVSPGSATIQGVKQVSPHIIAAQVIKQAHAQYQSAALRPILPKPVVTTPMFIGGQVVAGVTQKNQTLSPEQQRHAQPDDKGFACNVCEVTYASVKELKKHIVVHAEKWPYKCEFCPKLYQDTDELIQHRTELHKVGKTFSCGVCKRDFAYKSNLRKHQTDIHQLVDMNYRELGPKELRAHNFTDPDRIKTGPPELPIKPDRMSLIEQGLMRQAPGKIGKLKLPLKTSSASSSPTRSTPSPRKSGPINPQRHHPFAYARQIGYLNMLNDPRNQEVLQEVSTHRCTKCLKEFTETAEFHGHIMECALEGLDQMSSSANKETKDKNIDAERIIDEASEKRLKMKAYTKSKKKAIQQRQSGPGKRQRAKPGLKIYNPNKYTGRRASSSVDDVHACPGCDKKFYFINKLERHMRMCPNRDKFLKGKKVVVEARVQNANKDILKKGHCCPFCTRQFTYLKSLKKHALVCLARNPNEEDPIRLVEENFKNAQQMAAELQSTETKEPTDIAVSEEVVKHQSKNPNGGSGGKKKRRRKKRTDVIPRPKKRKRLTSSTESKEDPKGARANARKPGAKKGTKGKKLVVKVGQKDLPKKRGNVSTTDTSNAIPNKRPLVDGDLDQVETLANESGVLETHSMPQPAEKQHVEEKNQSEPKHESVLDDVTGALVTRDPVNGNSSNQPEPRVEEHDQSSSATNKDKSPKDSGQDITGNGETVEKSKEENLSVLKDSNKKDVDKADVGNAVKSATTLSLDGINNQSAAAGQDKKMFAENKDSVSAKNELFSMEHNSTKIPLIGNDNGLAPVTKQNDDSVEMEIRCPETGTVMGKGRTMVASN